MPAPTTGEVIDAEPAAEPPAEDEASSDPSVSAVSPWTSEPAAMAPDEPYDPAEDEASEATRRSAPGDLSTPATHAGSTLGGALQPWLEPATEFEPDDELAPEPERACLRPRGCALQGAAELEPASEPELAHEPELESEPEPRRGFFARLLARLGGEPPEPPPVQAAEPAEEIAGAEPGQESHNAMSQWAALMVPEQEPEGESEAIVEHSTSPQDAIEQPFESAMPNIEAEPEDLRAPSLETTPEGLEAEEIEPQDISAEIGAAEEIEPEDVSAQIGAAEEIASDEVTAVLTGVLDRLGAAHHRPFSRS